MLTQRTSDLIGPAISAGVNPIAHHTLMYASSVGTREFVATTAGAVLLVRFVRTVDVIIAHERYRYAL